jgi:hypothetical protein
MPDDGILGELNFAELAKSRSIAPHFQLTHGAAVLEVLGLIEAAEELGDCVLRLARIGRLDLCLARGLLERLLKCYSEPLANTRELAQIRIELGKLKQ